MRRAVAAFHHTDDPVLIVSSPGPIKLDLAVITPRGIGVLEMKGNSGLIDVNPVTQRWEAGGRVIRSGTKNTPHEQVRDYAEQLRARLKNDCSGSDRSYLPGRSDVWDDLKFNTAVCFTHPNAGLSLMRRKYVPFRHQKSWEEFDFVTPMTFTDWVFKLSFEKAQKVAPGDYQGLRLTEEQARSIALKPLDATEWTQVSELIGVGGAYGFLVSESSDSQLVLPLVRDSESLGKDPSRCASPIPLDGHDLVSRVHCEVRRYHDGAQIQDRSTNGTYVDGERVPSDEWVPLVPGATVRLGSSELTTGSATFRFVRELSDLPRTVLSAERP